jgi:hypothetical protein
MQAYSAYYENGRIITIGNPVIPEGRRLIVTVLDESVPKNRVERQRDAFRKFMTAMENTPPLSDEFDEIINQRVNIKREVDL